MTGFSAPLVIGRVRAVLTSRAVPYTRPGSFSAIDKQPRQGAVAVGAESLAGDEQGDRRVHGGPDKAVHVYPWAHYAGWRAELGALPLLQAPGAFGENLSVDGLDERGVCLGDEWRIGSARFAVSQGRQPCWKLNDRFGVPDMARRVQDTGRTGWYLRVLQAGPLQAGDAITLLARPHPDWPLERIAALIRQRVCEPATLREVLALPLPPSWQRLFTRRLEQGAAEDWAPRLQGPARQWGLLTTTSPQKTRKLTVITLALSKGRIFDETLPLLAAAGIQVLEDPEKSRKLILPTNQPDVRVVLVRASDVPTYVEYGGADLGVTGKDVLIEHGGAGLYQPLDLRIAECHMAVAAPEGFDYQKAVRQGSRITVATKYTSIARNFFADKGVHVDLIKLYGSMELAPLTGMADAIVDLVSTGKTLKANHLVEVEHIMDISSRLVVNQAALKLKTVATRRIIDAFASAVKAPAEV